MMNFSDHREGAKTINWMVWQRRVSQRSIASAHSLPIETQLTDPCVGFLFGTLDLLRK
jgi:hypothetical protein